ncbi:NACHT, LRR and PYD domains-containing protein 1b allele 2-like isoform X1 [Struthio camelus]|uniref:NACHT, LRR and PYD domains-containing protein 1b allele 2-like isoform X1 n=1 Tax=Struthio camelus TaxID=8801 RepID=UPI003603F98B
MEMSRSNECGFPLVAEREAEVLSQLQQDAALAVMSRFGFSSSSSGEDDSSDSDVSLLAQCREKDGCSHCRRDKNLPEVTVPEIIWRGNGKKRAYRVSLPGAGSFRCSETDLCFNVKAAVSLKYEYGSWRQHLRGADAEKWMFVGPLFNIQAEPADAVGAVYLPHFVCLRGQDDTSEMRIGHFVGGKLVLEIPVEVQPFHAVLEDPSFSFLGVIWRKITSVLHLPLHSLVLIYHATRKEPVTLHLYLIPDDHSIKQAIEAKEMSVSYRVDKPPLTKHLNCGRSYVVSGSPTVAIQPKTLDFHLRGADEQQIFSEIYVGVMAEKVKLSLKDRRKARSVWHTVLRQGDIMHSGAGADGPCASCWIPGLQRSRPGLGNRGPIPGASAQVLGATEKHFVDRHRVELIERVVEVKGVLDLLLEDVLDFEQYQRILAEKTSHSRMRELFRLMPSWTSQCKDRVYEALKKKHPYLIEDLEK